MEFQGKLHRPFIFKATRNVLWNRARIGRKVALKTESMLPCFKGTPRVVDHLWAANLKGGLFGFVSGCKYSANHFLNVKLSEYSFGARSTPRSSGDYSIKVFRGSKVSTHEFKFILQSILYKIDSYAEKECLEPLDLCKAVMGYEIEHNHLKIKMDLLYPFVPLQFQQINTISIVSTPLAVQLTRACKERFSTGYLTMDQKKRLLPLTTNTPSAFKYPLIGVWAAGNPHENKEFPFMHPLVWAACVRYLESNLVSNRISPDPTNNSFLLVYFADKPMFYEVSTTQEPYWAIATSHCLVTTDEGFLCSFVKGKQTASITQSSTTSEERLAFELSPKAEKMIEEHGEILKVVQRQLWDLQSQFNLNCLSPRLEKVQRVTHVLTPNVDHSGKMKIKGILRNCVSPNIMKTSHFQMVRGSCNIVQENKENSIIIPKILYESLSDTSEDEMPR